MVLADTSVWVEHFRGGASALSNLLLETKVYCHPFVIGELACGNLRNRMEILDLLSTLPRVVVSAESEALELIEANKLYGRGLGWIDIHLLSSALLTGVRLWTLDRRLKKIAEEFRLAF